MNEREREGDRKSSSSRERERVVFELIRIFILYEFYLELLNVFIDIFL